MNYPERTDPLSALIHVGRSVDDRLPARDAASRSSRATSRSAARCTSTRCMREFGRRASTSWRPSACCTASSRATSSPDQVAGGAARRERAARARGAQDDRLLPRDGAGRAAEPRRAVGRRVAGRRPRRPAGQRVRRAGRRVRSVPPRDAAEPRRSAPTPPGRPTRSPSVSRCGRRATDDSRQPARHAPGAAPPREWLPRRTALGARSASACSLVTGLGVGGWWWYSASRARRRRRAHRRRPKPSSRGSRTRRSSSSRRPRARPNSPSGSTLIDRLRTTKRGPVSAARDRQPQPAGRPVAARDQADRRRPCRSKAARMSLTARDRLRRAHCRTPGFFERPVEIVTTSTETVEDTIGRALRRQGRAGRRDRAGGTRRRRAGRRRRRRRRRRKRRERSHGEEFSSNCRRETQMIVFGLLCVLTRRRRLAGADRTGRARSSRRAARGWRSSQGEVARAQAIAAKLPALQREVQALEVSLRETTAVAAGREGSAGRAPQPARAGERVVARHRELHAEADRRPRRSTPSGRSSSASRAAITTSAGSSIASPSMSRLMSVSDLHIKTKTKPNGRGSVTAYLRRDDVRVQEGHRRRGAGAAGRRRTTGGNAMKARVKRSLARGASRVVRRAGDAASAQIPVGIARRRRPSPSGYDDGGRRDPFVSLIAPKTARRASAPACASATRPGVARRHRRAGARASCAAGHDDAWRSSKGAGQAVVRRASVRTGCWTASSRASTPTASCSSSRRDAPGAVQPREIRKTLRSGSGGHPMKTHAFVDADARAGAGVGHAGDARARRRAGPPSADRGRAGAAPAARQPPRSVQRHADRRRLPGRRTCARCCGSSRTSAASTSSSIRACRRWRRSTSS